MISQMQSWNKFNRYVALTHQNPLEGLPENKLEDDVEASRITLETCNRCVYQGIPQPAENPLVMEHKTVTPYSRLGTGWQHGSDWNQLFSMQARYYSLVIISLSHCVDIWLQWLSLLSNVAKCSCLWKMVAYNVSWQNNSLVHNYEKIIGCSIICSLKGGGPQGTDQGTPGITFIFINQRPYDTGTGTFFFFFETY